MKTKSTDSVVLERVQSTSLFQPRDPGPGENLLFLRWDRTNVPASLPLEKTWANTGTPTDAGYFLFLNILPPSDEVASFETEIIKMLPAPTTSAFAWVSYVLKNKLTSIQTLLKTKLNDDDEPSVEGNTELVLLPGQKRVVFGDGSSILANLADGFIDGFVITYPPITGTQSSGTLGVTLPFVGSLVGCVLFPGLINSLSGRRDAESARKTLVTVSIDPLHPLDPKRNFEEFTGEDFILSQDGETFTISRAN